MKFEVPKSLCTMAGPERLEGHYMGARLAYWYWILGGRMFVSSWSISPKHSKETHAAREAEAYQKLLDYVDASLPPRPEDDSAEAIDGCNLIRDGGLLPKPPAIQPEINPPNGRPF